MTLRVRVSYADRHSSNQAAPLPLFLGQDAGNGTILDDTVIDSTNIYNPFGFTLNTGTYSFIGRRMVEAGPRHFEQEVQTWDVAATLEGQWNMFGRDWYWDANATWGQNDAAQAFTGDINVARVQQALGPAAGCTAPCVPLNVFGGAGTITQAMLDFIGYTERNSSEAELADFTFNITGNLMDLPAGPLAIASGYEHRRVSGSFDPDPVTEAGLTSDIPAHSGSGSYDVDELYAELRVPIAANQPFAYLLEGSLAGRVFDYSTSGRDSTFSAGLRLAADRGNALPRIVGPGFPGSDGRGIVRRRLAFRRDHYRPVQQFADHRQSDGRRQLYRQRRAAQRDLCAAQRPIACVRHRHVNPAAGNQRKLERGLRVASALARRHALEQ